MEISDANIFTSHHNKKKVFKELLIAEELKLHDLQPNSSKFNGA